MLLVIVAACAQPPQKTSRAPVIDAAGPVAEQRRDADAARLAKSRVAAEADMRETLERQSRRIAELESRSANDAESRQVIELIGYSQRVAAMRAEEQAREFAAVGQDYARDPGPYTRLRLALVLAIPATSFNDDARVASLLEPLSQGAKGPLRQFALLVHGLVGERIREQKRVAQLKEQMDGLRAIDRSLIEREQGRLP